MYDTSAFVLASRSESFNAIVLSLMHITALIIRHFCGFSSPDLCCGALEFVVCGRSGFLCTSHVNALAQKGYKLVRIGHFQ